MLAGVIPPLAGGTIAIQSRPVTPHAPGAAVLCALDDIDHAIAQMEHEQTLIAANIAELRQRQEAYQDVALMGAGEATG